MATRPKCCSVCGDSLFLLALNVHHKLKSNYFRFCGVSGFKRTFSSREKAKVLLPTMEVQGGKLFSFSINFLRVLKYNFSRKLNTLQVFKSWERRSGEMGIVFVCTTLNHQGKLSAHRMESWKHIRFVWINLACIEAFPLMDSISTLCLIPHENLME